ncbi:MAG: phosphatidate cytidylyltransferase [Anaerolineae bacterium]|nr:phosphatidate cytidylyltransferase [Anaerolineae bacterium]
MSFVVPTSDILAAGSLLAYYLLVVVLLPTLLKVLTKTPTELVRKMQHIAYSLSVFILLNLFSTWYVAVGAAFLLVLLAYPVLLLVEKTPRYLEVFVDRTKHGGELRKQLLYVQLSFAILISVYWGLMGPQWRYVVAVAVMGWGFGDAAAALIGKRFGRRRFLTRYIEGAKTHEGLWAMMVVAGTALFYTLLLYAGKPWYVSLVMSTVVAPVCGIVELFSRRGTDTLTVPLAAAAVTRRLAIVLSLLGW